MWAGVGFPQASKNSAPQEWQAERERLRSLLAPEMYEKARASTLNAHYTSATVIDGIYKAVERLGFRGGRVLEPALGVGHFFGLMPSEMADRSSLTGIELDPLTASIARHLYPDSDIRAVGFESARLVAGSFDLAISNVPFGDYKLHDPQFNERNFLVHDYFFAKGVDQVRPGGMVVFITSKGTLDKVNSGLRDYLYDKSRFPRSHSAAKHRFQAKREYGGHHRYHLPPQASRGRKARRTGVDEAGGTHQRQGEAFQINEYFAAHPHMMLGTMALAGTMYRSNEPALVPDGRDLGAALPEAVAAFTPGHLPPARAAAPPRRHDFRDDPRSRFREGECLCRARRGAGGAHGRHTHPLQGVAEETGRRIRGLIKVRDAVREVLRTQLQEVREEEIVAARRAAESPVRCIRFALRRGE